MNGDPCGRYHKHTEESYPIVWDGELITSVQDFGDDVLCTKHAFMRFGQADEENQAGTVSALRADGYTVEKEDCDVEWTDDTMLYNEGALIFSGEEGN